MNAVPEDLSLLFYEKSMPKLLNRVQVLMYENKWPLSILLVIFFYDS